MSKPLIDPSISNKYLAYNSSKINPIHHNQQFHTLNGLINRDTLYNTIIIIFTEHCLKNYSSLVSNFKNSNENHKILL